jgi:hypothetical protein
VGKMVGNTEALLESLSLMLRRSQCQKRSMRSR